MGVGQANIFNVTVWGSAAERLERLMSCVENSAAFRPVLADYLGALSELRWGRALTDLMETSKHAHVDGVYYDLLAYEYQSVTLGIVLAGRIIFVVDVDVICPSSDARVIAREMGMAWVR